MSLYPGYRAIDSDGDILMADANIEGVLPVFRPGQDSPRQPRLTRPRLRPHAGARRLPFLTDNRQSRTEVTGTERLSAAPTTLSDRQSLASSPFGDSLRHLPPPHPTMDHQQTYSPQGLIPPRPGRSTPPTLPSFSSIFSDSYRKEDAPTHQEFSPSPRNGWTAGRVDLTQGHSSPPPPFDHFSIRPDRNDSLAQPNPETQLQRRDFQLLSFLNQQPESLDLDPNRRPPRPQTPAHAHRRRLTRPSTPKVACTACLEDFKRDDLLELACNCLYCTPCLNLSFKSGCANMASFPPKCCGRPLRISVWGSLLEPNVLNRYKQIEAEFSTNRPLYCASPKCSMFISESDILPQQDVGVCPKCSNSTCKQCRRLMNDHPVWQIDERVCPKDEENVTKLYELGSENSWKQCPTCLNMVEKLDGCNHMDCICGVEFCYSCGNLFDEDDACECEPNAWDNEGETDEDEDDDDENDEESDEEWPDFRAAVDPAGRPKCLHQHAAPLGTNLFACHGCLEPKLLFTCEDCALELCRDCIDRVQKASQSGSGGNTESSSDNDTDDSDATI